jgi:hypothetical protein
VCGQISDLTGAPAQGAFPLAKAVDVISDPGNIDLASLFTGWVRWRSCYFWPGRGWLS